MILFKKDWANFPNAIADTNTTNQSFIRMAILYEKMGIKNNLFHLSLLQPSLQGVNPFSPDLDDETKVAIALECRWNPWYCIREIIRLPPQGGPTPIRYVANRGNLALTWSFFNHIDFSLIQPRQTGKSASTDCIWIIAMFLMGSHTAIQLITKDDKLRKENIDRLKGIRNQLPAYLNPTSISDSDNKEMLTCKARSNTYKTAVGRSDKAAADNIGRGLTSPIIHSDESPYTRNIHISLPAALSSSTAARDNAKKADGLYSNVFTTTAGKKDTAEGRFIFNLVHNAMRWNESLLDSQDIYEALETILQNSHSKKPMINGTFSHKQLGKSDEWLVEAMNNSRATGEVANRDYLNIWTTGTESSPLSVALNEIIHSSERDPNYTQVTKDRYLLRWYIPQEHIEKYMADTWNLICLDSSNAIGRDNNGFTIQNIKTMEVIAAANLAEANLYQFAKWIVDLLVLYPKTVFIIENKSSAQGIIDTLITILPSYGIDPFKRIYNRVVDNKERHEDVFREIQRPLLNRSPEVYQKYKNLFGFMTTGNSRAFIYDTVLQHAAKTTGHLVRDKVLSEEIRSLVTFNGRVDHPIGGHDDLCFVGDTLVRTITGNKPIKELKIGDLVLTRKGYKPIVRLFCSEKEVITKYGLTGTPNHPFITPNGELQFKDLKPETLVYVWNEKLLITEIKTITDILNPKEHSTEITFTDTINGRNHPLHFIDRFMKMFMGQFHQGKLFITKTETFSTTVLKISNVLRKLSIVGNIQRLKKFVKREQLTPEKEIRLVHGEQTIQNLQSKYILRMVQNLQGSITGEKKIQNLQSEYIQKPLKKASKQEERKEIVYNIMVADCHEYFVNDILVHNCLSWLMGHWFIRFARNIEFYGLDPADCMSMVVEDGATANPEELVLAGKRKKLRLEIENIKNDLSNSKSVAETFRLEMLLKQKIALTASDGGEILTLDNVIKEVEATKKKTRSLREAVAKYCNK